MKAFIKKYIVVIIVLLVLLIVAIVYGLNNDNNLAIETAKAEVEELIRDSYQDYREINSITFSKVKVQSLNNND